jgi:hypothetical protein
VVPTAFIPSNLEDLKALKALFVAGYGEHPGLT